MKEKLSFPVHFREVLIATAIAIVFLSLGGVFDESVSTALYINSSSAGRFFAIIASGLVEIPGYIIFFAAGFSLIATSIKAGPLRKVLSFILGGIVALLAFYLTFSTFQNIGEFEETENKMALITLLGAFLVTVIDGFLAVYIVYYLKRHPEKNEELFRLAIILVTLIAAELIFQQLLKYLASRPRPYAVFNEDYDASFKAFYEWQPFAAASLGDAYKSFPSGHTATASLLMFLLPLIANFFVNLREKKWLGILLFYTGMVFGMTAGLSRIYAGAHFLSDVSAGMLLSLITSFVSLLVVRIILKKIYGFDDFISVNDANDSN